MSLLFRCCDAEWRRCLNGRHARAGRSPRGSEVGAPAENRPVDRPSTRGTLDATTDVCRCGIPPPRSARPPERGCRVRARRGRLEIFASDGGRRVADPGEAAVTVPEGTRQTTMAASPPGGRKRQRSLPERAETAPRARFAAGEGGGDRFRSRGERRIERGAARQAPEAGCVRPGQSGTRKTPDGSAGQDTRPRQGTARRRAGSGRLRGSRRERR